jgi:hypothetical protein
MSFLCVFIYVFICNYGANTIDVSLNEQLTAYFYANRDVLSTPPLSRINYTLYAGIYHLDELVC